MFPPGEGSGKVIRALLVAGVIADRFEVLPERTSGGMATVYRARDRQTGTMVAVKILTESEVQSIERFNREATMLAGLIHPGIVKYIAHGTTPDGQHYMVMEWVDGETLNQRFARVGLTAAEAIATVRRVAVALDVAHRRGIVHRDIKPDNILFRGGNLDEVKLIDFGIARRFAGEGDEHRLTTDGGFVGTPGYMSPEQARGDRDIDAGADVFSLGCILYQCLTGRPPFVAGNVASVLTKILIAEPRPVRKTRPDVPVEVEALLTRVLAKQKVDRPRDAQALVAALDALPPIESGLRRRNVVEEMPTQHGPAATSLEEASCLVFTTLATTDDAAAAAALGARIRGVVNDHGGRVESLDDGSLVISMTSKLATPEQVAKTAECALRIREILPTAPIIITTGAPGMEQTEDPVDRGMHTLVRSIREVIFTGRMKAAPTPDAIWVDETTAKILGSRYSLQRTTGGSFLRR
jgi:eukaryotic-like serine/threonine-protein kinase